MDLGEKLGELEHSLVGFDHPSLHRKFHWDFSSGIEIVRKYQLYDATRFAIRKLPNVKTACADAKIVLRDHVRPGSVAAVHVYFPDPWWKKRHKKRRVLNEQFLRDVERTLQSGGRLHFWTDERLEEFTNRCWTQRSKVRWVHCTL